MTTKVDYGSIDLDTLPIVLVKRLRGIYFLYRCNQDKRSFSKKDDNEAFGGFNILSGKHEFSDTDDTI